MSAPRASVLALIGASPSWVMGSYQPNTKSHIQPGNWLYGARGGRYRAVAKANGLSPEIPIVSEADIVHKRAGKSPIADMARL